MARPDDFDSMTTIGGWWLSSYRLASEEALLHKYPTNYFSGEARPYGGRLYVTDRRLVFLPHRIDAMFGGSNVSLHFDDLNDVSSEAEYLEDGELDTRRIPIRLRVETLDGEVHFFVVEDLDRALEEVHLAIGISDNDDPAPP